MSLIESYKLEIEVSTHSTEIFEYEAIAHLSVDISSALPYLNATLSRGIYLPNKPVLSWRHEGCNISFWSRRIAVDNLESKEQAKETADRLVELVNRAWAERGQIEPDTTTHKLLKPLEVYGLLPQTNCKLCGENTCYNFALKLTAGQAKLEQCTPLYEDDAHEARRAKLEALFAAKWPVF